MRWPEKMRIRLRWYWLSAKSKLKGRAKASIISRDPYPIRAEAEIANQVIDLCNRLLSWRIKVETIEAALKIAWRKAKDARQKIDKRSGK